MKLAIDAMGGDHAPEAILKGVARAAEDNGADVTFVLVGDEVRLKQANDPNGLPERCLIEHAPEIIGMDEHPVEALRTKRNNSISVSLGLLKSGAVDAFYSAGNTGAVVAAATLQLGLLPRVQRAGIAAILPTSRGPCVLMDVGANVNCRPAHLYQYAVMASALYTDLFGEPAPSVGLLSVGGESGKGNMLVKQTHRLLDQSPLNFAGNVEGQDIYSGAMHCVIVEGFTGNVILKVSETLGLQLTHKLLGKLAALDHGMTRTLTATLEQIDWEKTGGAVLLGVTHPVIIGHGRSTPEAIAAGLTYAATSVRHQLAAHIAEGIAAAQPHLDAKRETTRRETS